MSPETRPSLTLGAASLFEEHGLDLGSPTHRPGMSVRLERDDPWNRRLEVRLWCTCTWYTRLDVPQGPAGRETVRDRWHRHLDGVIPSRRLRLATVRVGEPC